MLVSIQWRPVTGSPLTLNDLSYPIVEEFNPVTEYENVTPLKKMQAPGVWPNYNYPGQMSIAIAGDIVGTSSADYVTKRMAFMTAFHVPLALQTVRKHGDLRVEMEGWGMTADAACQVVSVEAPMDASFPSVTSYRVALRSFYPAFVNGGTEFRAG
jgi:hypothetical protein